jgi:histone acetyltransferase (RNA polymerase elongator complex component)
MKRVIVPFFIAHQGCPHRCVFCDQRSITGRDGELPEPAELLRAIETWRSSSGAEAVEVAFYGGTFTALSRRQQETLLQPPQPLLASGRVSAVRLSTRPDAVDAANADFLRAAGVTLVELGVQSMADHVLAAAGRGHSAADTVAAFATLRAAGLQVGAQLMPGLPCESYAGALASFRSVLALKPDLLRIYPAVVLKGTALAGMYRQGNYSPLSLGAAVNLCKIMLQEAALAAVPVIRVGLQPTGDLAAGGAVLAGPCHPALRQLAEGERWYDLLQILAARFASGARLTLQVPPPRIADVVGQKRCNIIRLARFSGRTVAAVTADHSLADGAIRISDSSMSISGDLLRDLTYKEDF